MSAQFRVGTCSVCHVAMESPDGSLERARVRNRAVRKQGHHHRRPWSVVPDEPPGEDRAWHDRVPGFAR